jgi:hypothetical protein
MRKAQPLAAPRIFLTLTVLAMVLILGGRSTLAQETKDKWPKRFEHPKGTVVMYQPQLESWQGDVLTAYAAVSAQKKEWKNPVFGALWLTGRVLTDRDTRMATIEDVKITDIKFPGATPEQLEKVKTFLNTEVAGATTTISLDRLLAALEVVKREQAGDTGLKNNPPRIIFATHPTVLVSLDGDPKLLPVPDSKLMRVANTPFLMLYDPAAKTYFLKGGADWLSAMEVTGSWKDVEKVPAAITALEAKAKAGKMPEVMVSTVPAELLVTDGEPQYTPISGTALLYVSNTESNIFMDTGTQEYYVLISGRWFKSKSLQDGPWSYAAPDKLPGDFAKIPPGSAKGFVLASVAGSQQAREAILDNNIPQTAAINRKTATTQVNYDGDPKWDKIANTNLEYAVNTGTPVFKEGTKYYAVDQGVWYEADSPNGPWKVSVSPPSEVNNIPPSNPNYNAKYVKVYQSTDEVAYVGYTPGYTGSYVDNGTVVYGTGYDYPGYSSPNTYIPAQPTYGYAATYNPYAGAWGYQPSYYNPWNWLAPSLLGFGAGMLTGYAIWGSHNYYGGGWWGPGGYNNVNVNITHNYINNRHWNPDNRWHGGRPIYHPVTRPGERPRPTPYAGNRPNIYNRPGNQNLLASRPGTHPATRPAAGVKPERPSQAARTRPETRPGQAKPQLRPTTGRNNVIADKGGHVYRRDAQGNWQQRQGNQWSRPQAAARPATRPVTPPSPATRPSQVARPTTPARPSFNTSQLNRDFQARERGQVRTQQFQRAQSAPAFRSSSPSAGGGYRRGGGGGYRGGGGGGGRRR